MAFEQLLHIPFLLALCQIIYGAVGQQCKPKKAETSNLGMMLRRHIYQRITGVEYGNMCLLNCYQDDRCQSFNYVISQYMCELNNRTKEARPEDYVPDSDRYYFGREQNRVPLGSIPELPAGTCKEIKASEGGQAVSGIYWFDSIIPGMTVTAHCDMTKEDVDECSSSIAICDANANCQNTDGSFGCFCKAGFTGDGKSCKDIDECSSSIQDCDVNANCQNTPGNFVCSCKPGFTGDGKICADIDECSASVPVCDVNANCQNTQGSHVCSCKAGFTGDEETCVAIVLECDAYTMLNTADRKDTYNTDQSNERCDSALISGWYRFVGDAGTKMPTSCVPEYRCGTNAPGWLNGLHPTQAEGQVTRQVCFTWSGNCCQANINIKVRNCGLYYVYYFPSSPGCTGYCGTN